MSENASSGIDEVEAIDSDYRYPTHQSIVIEDFSDDFLEDLNGEGENVKTAILTVLSEYCQDLSVNAGIFHFSEPPYTHFDNHTCYNIEGAGTILHVHVAGLDSVVACIE